MLPEHKGSREMYDYIADWVAPPGKDAAGKEIPASATFFYSKNDVWHRFGMLGVFGDYVLSSTQGDVLEIGCGESSIYLTAIAQKYSRRIYHCDAAPSKILNPLSIPGCFGADHVYFEEKDPTPDNLARCVLFAGPSDELFKRGIVWTQLALAFIDGDHIYEQARKDFDHIVPLVVDNGFIILHDTYPPDEEHLSEHRCGGVYRLRQEIEASGKFDVMTLTRGAAMGVGLTICRKKPAQVPYYQQ